MRVLLTTDTLGGVWTFTEELTLGLLAKGHDVALLSFGRLPNAQQVLWARRTSLHFGASFLYLPSTAPLEWMTDNTRAWHEGARAIHRAIARFAPDLLHVSQLCYGQIDAGIPVIVTAHSDVLSWAEACRPDGMESSSWFDRYVQLASAGITRATCITAPTTWMAAAIERLYLPRTQTSVKVISNGRTIKPQAQTKLLQAVTAGRLWDDAKGLTVLENLRTTFPILIAGEPSYADASAPTLPSNLSRTVTFTGLLTEPELLNLFAESSVYLATSVYEPFGLAPLEAALCGCAVVARDLPSLHEVWGESALYFNDATSLTSLLHALAEDPILLAAVQQRSLARAQTYTASKMVISYLTLYRSLLDQAEAHRFTPSKKALTKKALGREAPNKEEAYVF